MTTLSEMSPADRHRAVAAEFSQTVAAVEDWQAQSPVADWNAGDVVNHLVLWLPGFLTHGAGVPFPTAAGTNPATRWERHQAAVQELLDSSQGEQLLENSPLGPMKLAELIDQIYTVDVFMHRWDLGRAAGLDVDLEDSLARRLHEGMAPMYDQLLESGQFGPSVPVAEDDTPTRRLVGLIGRDPDWQPPA